MNNNLSEIETKLKIKFKNSAILQEAFIHRSFLNEAGNKNLRSNERLEFLGDSVLSFWVATEIFNRYPDFPEGKLTFLKTYLIKTETLANLAEKLSLGKYLKMSRGEEAGGGKQNPNLLANCFEALVGAIYQDQGYGAVQNFLKQQFEPILKGIKDTDSLRDAKSILQEKVQAAGFPTPVYKEISSLGPDHQKIFTMGVYVGNKILAQGSSFSKQEAEEKAASEALKNNSLEKLLKIK